MVSVMLRLSFDGWEKWPRRLPGGALLRLRRRRGRGAAAATAAGLALGPNRVTGAIQLTVDLARPDIDVTPGPIVRRIQGPPAVEMPRPGILNNGEDKRFVVGRLSRHSRYSMLMEQSQ